MQKLTQPRQRVHGSSRRGKSSKQPWTKHNWQNTSSSRRGKSSTQPDAKDACSPLIYGLFFIWMQDSPLIVKPSFSYPLSAIQMQD
jgi:hypothetical protein